MRRNQFRLKLLISFCEIEAIGCDGTVINTGHKNGVIARVEQVLGRPVQWLVCQLHANEIPLRHLIMALDGKSTGPSSFTGPIGKALSGCDKLPITEFESIPIARKSILMKQI